MIDDTIYAVASGRPPAGIAVLRVSGPASHDVARTLTGSLPPPRFASLRALRDEDGLLLDRAIVVVFEGGASSTGEDSVEFHLHGGRAVIAAVSSFLARQDGLREATAGEFTRRALRNGKLDLAEVEGLSDLLAAETEQQRRMALHATEGRTSRLLADWRERIAILSARVEATIDFDEEDDVASAGLTMLALAQQIAAFRAEVVDLIDRPSTERWRDGIRVVLAGPRNAGKSTLFNRLLERDAAIVSSVAGTTRDRLEGSVTRNGVPYVLVDTAGLIDTTEDIVERIGIDRARDAAQTADLVLWLGDDDPPVNPDQTILIHSRADEVGRIGPHPARIQTSHLDDDTTAAVWSAIEHRAQRMLPRPNAVALNERMKNIAREVEASLAEPRSDPLVLAEALRSAHHALASAQGRHAPDDMLNALFSSFCIGK